MLAFERSSFRDFLREHSYLFFELFSDVDTEVPSKSIVDINAKIFKDSHAFA